MRSKRLQLLLLATAFLTSPAVGAGEATGEVPHELEGLPITRIEFERENVFDTTDPEMSAWPYRWANALHIVSKEGFLRSMLVFEVGDPWCEATAAESARILRSLGFLNPVYITAHREGDAVVVTVRTHDKWTLQVGGKLGKAGSREYWGIEFDEKNFIGRGRNLKVEYESDYERQTWTYAYADPNLFRTRWRARLLFADASDGQREEVLAERPFYSLETARAWGGLWKHWQQIEHLYSDSVSVISGNRDFTLLDLWFGLRLPGPDARVRRLRFGFNYDQQLFSDWQWNETETPYPPPTDRTISGPRITVEQFEDRFDVLTGFRAWSAQEDIAFGSTWNAGLTISRPELGGDIPRFVLDARWAYRKRVSDWLWLGDVWASGRLDDGRAANIIGGFQIACSQLGERGWQARLYFEGSHALDRELQLSLGAILGLRGWDPETFDGTGRAVANLQWRTLLKEDFLHLFSIGAVVFVDAGKTWNPRIGFDTDGVRFDAGVGLLVDLTHIGLASLVRLDLAWPDDGGSPTIIVTSTALF